MTYGQLGRRDLNEPEIIDALRAIGATVVQLHEPCDLLVGYMGQTYMLEVKAPRGKLTEDQEMFVAKWRGSLICIVRDVDEALSVIAREKGKRHGKSA